MAIPVPEGEGPHPVRRFVLPAIFVLVLFATLIWRADQPELAVYTGKTMGTTFTVKVVNVVPSKQADLEKNITAALESVNRRMSTYQNDSELMKINGLGANQPMAISDELHEVVQTGLQLSAKTQGAFDITIGPVVNAYGFGPKQGENPPTDDELNVLKMSVGYQKIKLSSKEIEKEHADLFIDLSSIAKGYGVDKTAQILNAAGYEHYLVEVGGEVRTRGLNASGEAWRLGIETPQEGQRQLQRVIPLSNRALATSGDYRNYYEKDGVRISHTIDARTYKPITHKLASVSVLHDNCMHADAWATALNVLGDEEGLALAEKEGLAALFIVRQNGRFEEIETRAFKTLTTGTVDHE